MDAPRVEVSSVRLDGEGDRYGWSRGGMGGWVGIQPLGLNFGGIMIVPSELGMELLQRQDHLEKMLREVRGGSQNKDCP